MATPSVQRSAESMPTSVTRHLPLADPLSLFTRAMSKMRTIWLRLTFPFAHFGKGVSIHYSCEIPRHMAPSISFCSRVSVIGSGSRKAMSLPPRITNWSMAY